MKTMKWICRYLFLGLLTAAAVFWYVYCCITCSQLQQLVQSKEYIDLAAKLSPQAITILERMEQFELLRSQALIIMLVAIGLLLVMVLWQVIGTKIAKKRAAMPPKEKKAKQPKPPRKKKGKEPEIVAAAEDPNAQLQPAAPAVQAGFCTNCGKHYDQMPKFCNACGEKLF